MRFFRKPVFLVITLCTLLQLSPISVREFQYSGSSWHPVRFTSNAQIINPSYQADLDGDGKFEKLLHIEHQALIESNGKILWQSPGDWQVIQALISDLNQDDQPEVVLLLKRPFEAWPVDRWLPYGGRISDFQDASGLSCHIILIGWMNDRYKEIWAGSSMSQPALAIGAADFDQDGKIEMVTLEGSYNEKSISAGNAIKLWEWNGFGFSLLDTIPGNYHYFIIIKSSSNPRIITLISY